MEDPVFVYTLLCLSALAAGTVNSIAGGGTLLTFSALLGFLGNPIAANGTSTVALLPGSAAGAWGFRREVRKAGPLLVWLLAPSLAGGIVGALLVTGLDKRIFEMLVPWLILGASTLFLLQRPISRAIAAWRQAGKAALPLGVIVVVQFAIAVYGGYFGAGIGILMVANLALAGEANIHHMNATKTLLACAINGAAAANFMLQAQVVWPFALAMAGAAIVGGYLGARFSRRLPQAVVRGLVIAIGFGLAGYYFFREWYTSKSS